MKNMYRRFAVSVNIWQWVTMLTVAYVYVIRAGGDEQALNQEIESVVAWSTAAIPLPESQSSALLMALLMAWMITMWFGLPLAIYRSQDERNWFHVALAMLSFKYPFVGTAMIARWHTDRWKLVAGISTLSFFWMWAPLYLGSALVPV